MLIEVADGVWVRQSEWVWSNAVVVRGEDGAVMVDPGIDGSDLSKLADDVEGLGFQWLPGSQLTPTGAKRGAIKDNLAPLACPKRLRNVPELDHAISRYAPNFLAIDLVATSDLARSFGNIMADFEDIWQSRSQQRGSPLQNCCPAAGFRCF